MRYGRITLRHRDIQQIVFPINIRTQSLKTLKRIRNMNFLKVRQRRRIADLWHIGLWNPRKTLGTKISFDSPKTILFCLHSVLHYKIFRRAIRRIRVKINVLAQFRLSLDRRNVKKFLYTLLCFMKFKFVARWRLTLFANASLVLKFDTACVTVIVCYIIFSCLNYNIYLLTVSDQNQSMSSRDRHFCRIAIIIVLTAIITYYNNTRLYYFFYYYHTYTPTSSLSLI